MTLDLNAIKARVDKACPGPWYTGTIDPQIVFDRDYILAECSLQGPNKHNADRNAAFIAAARSDIPALLQAVERLTAERDALAAYPKRPIPTFASPVEELDYWRTEAINLDTWYAVATEARADLESRLARLTADHAALRTHKDALQSYVVEMWEAFRPYLTPELQAKWDAARSALGGGNG